MAKVTGFQLTSTHVKSAWSSYPYSKYPVRGKVSTIWFFTRPRMRQFLLQIFYNTFRFQPFSSTQFMTGCGFFIPINQRN